MAELTKASYAQVSLVTNRLHDVESERDAAIRERDEARDERGIQANKTEQWSSLVDEMRERRAWERETESQEQLRLTSLLLEERAEYERLKAESERLRGEVERWRVVGRGLIQAIGISDPHVDGCPCNDTCACLLALAVNEAATLLNATTKEPSDV